MPSFKINDNYRSRADQPQAIEKLSQGVREGQKIQTLLGATGTGKTFTMASIIAELQRPALVIAHNKTLAAQLVSELRELLPENSVQYFVSYYDYYQPEAYVPRKDLYIEKDASVNEDIDRLRHAATSSLLRRSDTVVVASVSCIYGIGSPASYSEQSLILKTGEEIDYKATLAQLTRMHYERNNTALSRGTFSWRGELLEIWPSESEKACRVRLWGDEIEKITTFNPTSKEEGSAEDIYTIWPASHYAASEETIERATCEIEKELRARLKELKDDPVAYNRLKQRTEYDLEMLRELGWTSGIENYSAILDGRKPGEAPHTLLDYFPDDFLLFLDESHQTVPQIGAMYTGDRARKQTLVDHGFRLPSALDNRPLKWEEFLKRTGQMICMSATPGKWEKKNSSQIAEQIVRPTGILDPRIEIRPTAGQVDDLLEEIKKRKKENERVLITTLTKRMAEDLWQYLLERNIKARYLHSDVETLERIETIRDLRSGKFDVLVGVNLLREGLDLPEVSLVAILDADKEGFLRGETSLVQTIGRAARNPRGQVIFYADKKSEAMKKAIKETNRRRKLQKKYNEDNNIQPQKLLKGPADDLLAQAAGKKPSSPREIKGEEDLQNLLVRLQKEMEEAAEELRFEEAARLRDEIADLSSDSKQYE